jgi:hypothetical protein
MPRTHRVYSLAVGIVAGLVAASPAQALKIRMSPLPERVAQADAVVVGKVTEIEKKPVSAKPFPDAEDKMEYQVAVVEITNGIRGTGGLTHVRVAFPPPEPDAPPRPGIRRGPVMTLTKGQEGCFFLQQHFAENFYVMQPSAPSLDAKSDTFKEEVALAERFAKLLAEPMNGLKSKDVEQRLQTAGLLVARYRMPKPGQLKQEPIAAEESKLILKALLDADFSKPYQPNEVSAQQTFFLLGLEEKDGWNPAPFQNFQQEFPAAAKKWLKEHAETYRIKRFVAGKAEGND